MENLGKSSGEGAFNSPAQGASLWKKILIYGAPILFGLALLGSFVSPAPALARIGIILVTIAALIPAIWFYRCEKKDRELAAQAAETAKYWQYLTAEDRALVGNEPIAEKTDRKWKVVGGSTAALALIGFVMIGSAPIEQPATRTPTQSGGGNNGSYQGEIYGSCDQARRDGAAPLYSKSPGYNPALDNDGDGVACE